MDIIENVKMKIAERYKTFNRRHRLEYEDNSALSFFLEYDCKNILDVGCGHNRFNKVAQKKGIDGIGIDFNKQNLKKNKDNHCLKLLVGDARLLPFKDESFNGVHCSHLIEHMLSVDAHKLLYELGRITKIGGILIIRTPVMWKWFYDDFTHIKPYYPNPIIRYMCHYGGQRTMQEFDFNFELVKLIWRYLPLIYAKNPPLFMKPILRVFDWLYKFHIHSWKKDAYMLVLRRVKI